MTLKIFGSIAIVGVAALAVACMWDRDTLAMEAKGLPEVIDVIGGRFDRNPDLYYEMRLERSLALLDQDAENIAAYGDVAVALDKLGRGKEAIELLEKRIKHIQRLGVRVDEPGESIDHHYQLLANLGTVRVHDWMRRGAPDDELETLKKSIKEIEKAVEINPEAHFGREFVQLHLMRLLLLDKQGDHGEREGAAEKLHTEFMNYSRGSVDKHAANRKIIEGAVGMIVLGGGWESPDMYAFLAGVMTEDQYNVLANLALKREQELLETGQSIFSDEMRNSVYVFGHTPMIDGSRLGEMDSYFKAVRENGIEHKTNRDEFMLAKLEKGEHPDTHDDFWDGYEEVARIDYKEFEGQGKSNTSQAWLIGLSIAIPVGFLALWYMTRRNIRKGIA